MSSTKEDPKIAKKVAKAAAKAAKKQPQVQPGEVSPVGGERTPAERAAEAAERQVALQRWRVVFAALAALIALISALIMWQRA